MADPLDIFARRTSGAAAAEADPLAVFAAPKKEDRWVRRGLFLVNERTGAKVFTPAIRGGEQTVDVPTLAPSSDTGPQARARPAFSDPKKEAAFQAWYRERATAMGLDLNPDAPEHHYDYRRAFEGGAETGYDPTSGEIHWPSAYKLADHPNRYVGIIDTLTGRPRPIPGGLPTEAIDASGAPAGGTPTSALESAGADPRVGGMASGMLRFLGVTGKTEEEKRFKQERLLSASYGPWIGLAEVAGKVPEGTRAAVRENYDQALSDYLTSDPEGGLGRAVSLTAGEIGAGLPSPSTLAGAGAGRLGSLATRGLLPAARVAAASLAGAAEQTAESYLDAKDLPVRERLAAAALGGGLGLAGAAPALRELPEALQTRGQKALASAMGDAAGAAPAPSQRLPPGIEELAARSLEIGEPPRRVVEAIEAPELGITRIDPDERLYVARDDAGKPVGSLVVRPGEDGFRVRHVFVEPEARGQQITEQLYTRAAEENGPYRGSTDYQGRLTPAGEAMQARLRQSAPQIYPPAEPVPTGNLDSIYPERGGDLSAFGPKLYRETNASGLRGILLGEDQPEGIFVANAPELAAGQGANRGIRVEFSSDGLIGTVNRDKPGLDRAASQGMAELRVGNPAELRNRISRVVAENPDALKGSYDGRLLLRQMSGWAKERLPEGGIAFEPIRRDAAEAGHLDLSTVAEDLKRWTKRNLYSGGRYAAAADDFATPEQRAFVAQEIPRRLERMEGSYRVALAGKDDLLAATDKAVRSVAKTRAERTKLYADMHLAAIGEKPLTDLPEPVRPLIARANDFVRDLSSEGLASGALPEELRTRIEAQQGSYRHRAYAAFDDPKHFRNVKRNAETWNAAYDYLRREMVDEPALRHGAPVTVDGQPAEVVQVGLRTREARKLAGQDPKLAAAAAAHWDAWRQGQITRKQLLSLRRALLNPEAQKIKLAHADDVRVRLADGTEKTVKKGDLRGGHFGSEAEIDQAILGVMNALADRPQGAEALVIASGAPSRINSILKERTNIPAPLRKLMGEYTDFRVSLERTVHNLAWDIETYKMLKGLADDGSALGVFRPEEAGPSGNLYQPVAGNASETGLGSRSPLAGMLTAPELRKALASEVEIAKIGWWSRLAGWTKAGKVVQNPGGIARNFYSHTITTTANGRSAVNPRLWGEVRRYMGDPALRDRAIAEGIIGDGFASREVEDYIKWIEASNNPVAQGYAALSKKFARAFRWGDDVWRLYNWIGETEDQMAARGLSRPEAEALAADRVKDTFQTYSRAPEIANRIRKNPILGSPAATFTIEGFRNVKNIAKYAAQDIREGLATGNRQLVAMGSRKVVGLLTASLALYATGKAAQKLAGVTQEQVDALRRQVVPRYHQDSELVVLKAKPGESVSYIDMSFLNPYNGISKPIIAAANKGGAGALVSVLEQISGGDIAAENVFELATGKRVESVWPLKTRGEVYSWDEPADDIARKAGYHAFRGFAPQFLVQGENLGRAVGLIPQQDDGFQRELGNELASTAGFRTTKLDLPQRMAASLGGFSARNGDRLNRVKKDMLDGQLDAGKALDALDASYQELRQIVSDYRALGMGDRDIFLAAKDKGLGKTLVALALRGEEDPPPPTLRPKDPAEANSYRALMAAYWQRYSE